MPDLPEQIAALTFPAQGLDLTNEFELQREGTTTVGENVRMYESLTQRARGGSRPGLSQYIPEVVGSSTVIQHLNYIVDPQAAALATTFDPLDTPVVPLGLGWGFGGGPFSDYGFPTIIDSTPNPGILPQQGGVQMPNGFWTRTGGSGIQPNRNVGTVPPPPPVPPAPVQFNGSNVANIVGSSTHSIGPGSFVSPGDTILVGFMNNNNTPHIHVVSVADDGINVYTQLGSAIFLDPNGGVLFSMELWYANNVNHATLVTAQLSDIPSNNWFMATGEFSFVALGGVGDFGDNSYGNFDGAGHPIGPNTPTVTTGILGAGTSSGMAVMFDSGGGITLTTAAGANSVTRTVGGSGLLNYLAVGCLLLPSA